MLTSEGNDNMPATPTITAAALIGIKTCKRVGMSYSISEKIKTKAITKML